MKAFLLYLDGRCVEVKLVGRYHLRMETPERQVRTAETWMIRPTSWCRMFGPLMKDEFGDYVYHEAAFFREDLYPPEFKK